MIIDGVKYSYSRLEMKQSLLLSMPKLKEREGK